jgi:hypothetical protein
MAKIRLEFLNEIKNPESLIPIFNSNPEYIRNEENNELLGTSCMLVPNPRDGMPWRGLLLIHGDMQSRGIGNKSLGLIEEYLKTLHW